MYGYLNSFILSKTFDNLNSFFRKKFFKFFKIFFVETSLSVLPDNNHKIDSVNLEEEIKKFEVVFNEKIIPWTAQDNLINQIDKLGYKNIKFLDIGAGSLSLFAHLNNHYKNLNYLYFDLPKYIEINKKIKKKFDLKNLFLIENLDTLESNVDLTYFGSSIQYIQDYKILLKGLFNKTTYFLISLTPFFNGEKKDDIIVKQVNLADSIHYHYILNLDKFINFMGENHFTLVNKEISKKIKFVNFKNFKKKYNDMSMLDLLFKKNK